MQIGRNNLLILATFVAATLAPAAAQIAPPSNKAKAKSDPERLICRTTVKTGTLAGRERQCFTRAQWDEIASHAHRRGLELQEGLRTRPCGDGSLCQGGE